MKPITAAQSAVLMLLGYPDTEVSGMSFAQARDALREVARRRERGLSTVKQVLFLKRNGVDATNMSFEEASARIHDVLAGRFPRVLH